MSIEGVGGGPAQVLLLNNTITGNTATITGNNLYINNVTVFNRQIFLPTVRKKS